MSKVLLPIADGSEEMEVVIVADVLRRADIEVTLASISENRKITASRGVEITADCYIAHCENKPWDMVVIPGGMPGTQYMAECVVLKRIIADQIKADGWLAAICAAPAFVLAANGYIKGTSATCFPACRSTLEEHDVHAINEPVVIFNKLITSQGPGTAMAFAVALIKVLKGDLKACEIAKEMVFNG
jgi:4-methyl-5(b-hydroxyethyl)-thiazole monophosphate biosynthesis